MERWHEKYIYDDIVGFDGCTKTYCSPTKDCCLAVCCPPIANCQVSEGVSEKLGIPYAELSTLGIGNPWCDCFVSWVCECCGVPGCCARCCDGKCPPVTSASSVCTKCNIATRRRRLHRLKNPENNPTNDDSLYALVCCGSLFGKKKIDIQYYDILAKEKEWLNTFVSGSRDCVPLVQFSNF